LCLPVPLVRTHGNAPRCSRFPRPRKFTRAAFALPLVPPLRALAAALPASSGPRASAKDPS